MRNSQERYKRSKRRMTNPHHFRLWKSSKESRTSWTQKGRFSPSDTKSLQNPVLFVPAIQAPGNQPLNKAITVEKSSDTGTEVKTDLFRWQPGMWRYSRADRSWRLAMRQERRVGPSSPAATPVLITRAGQRRSGFNCKQIFQCRIGQPGSSESRCQWIVSSLFRFLNIRPVSPTWMGSSSFWISSQLSSHEIGSRIQLPESWSKK